MTGSGTAGDPYIISTKADLQAMENDLTAYYELGANIDASGTGEGFTPITNFTGQLDGKGYAIIGFFINRTGSNRQALFGKISGSAVLNNISMTGVDITSDGYYTGALVGEVTGSSCAITNCNSAGAVESTHSVGFVGGLIARLHGGTVSDCYSTCTVATADYGGGLIGFMDDGDVEDCYATGAVTATDDYGGGFAGRIDAGDIDKCYATGAVVVGDDYGGGFVGYLAAGTINDCYARGTVTGTGNYHGGFVGYLANATIEDCYSTGAPTGDANIGGFCGYNATLTVNLRPTGAGDETNISSQYPATGEHWDKVDEVSADDATTRIYGVDTEWERDLYQVANHTTESGRITNVQVFVRCQGESPYSRTMIKAAIKTHGTVYEGSEQNPPSGGSWGSKYTSWATNPFTGVAWTWDEIDAVQIGCTLRDCETGWPSSESRVTQVYMRVTYVSGITNCFWDTETSGTEIDPGGGSGGATGKTTTQMKTESTFTDAGWDFTTPIWYISGTVNDGYPAFTFTMAGYSQAHIIG